MNVLIIEDSKLVSKMTSEMLSKIGHTSDSAEDGQIAINKIESKEQSYDLILLDWNMPNVNGEEFLVYNNEKKIIDCPIIMMTTENKIEKIQRAIELGVVEYIMKPFTQDVLELKIETIQGLRNVS